MLVHPLVSHTDSHLHLQQAEKQYLNLTPTMASCSLATPIIRDKQCPCLHPQHTACICTGRRGSVWGGGGVQHMDLSPECTPPSHHQGSAFPILLRVQRTRGITLDTVGGSSPPIKLAQLECGPRLFPSPTTVGVYSVFIRYPCALRPKQSGFELSSDIIILIRGAKPDPAEDFQTLCVPEHTGG